MIYTDANSLRDHPEKAVQGLERALTIRRPNSRTSSSGSTSGEIGGRSSDRSHIGGHVGRANCLFPHPARTSRSDAPRESLRSCIAGIVRDEDVRSGDPRIEGTRITAPDVKRRVIDVSEYGFVIADLFRALAYYYDHRDELGEREREADAARRDDEPAGRMTKGSTAATSTNTDRKPTTPSSSTPNRKGSRLVRRQGLREPKRRIAVFVACRERAIAERIEALSFDPVDADPIWPSGP